MDANSNTASAEKGLKDAVSHDADAERLASMGYQQDLKRNFSVLSVLGIGFSLTNSWWAVSAALITGVNSGGPCVFVYGTIVLFLISIGVGVSLSELASAMPNAAGQIFWAAESAPKRFARSAPYVTGWLVWAGSIFACGSVSLSVSSAAVGCYQLLHPDLSVSPYSFTYSLTSSTEVASTSFIY